VATRGETADRDGTFRITALPGDYVAQAFPRDAVSSRRNAWRLFAGLDATAIVARLGEREEKPVVLTLRNQQ
jgi:hypothetical protein